jgi:hypothetical protein
MMLPSAWKVAHVLDPNGIAAGVEEHGKGVDLGAGVGEHDPTAAVRDQERARVAEHGLLRWASACWGGGEGEDGREGQQGEEPSDPSWSRHGNHLPCGQAVTKAMTADG